MQKNLLKYKNYRYLKLSVVLIVASIVLYFTQGEAQPANGGTWQGYILGTISALLILWLTYLGIRKRRYKSAIGTLQGWTSAHVYLGASLLILATLHTAFQVGWNIHTLAYVLMVIVILSGFYGLFSYLHYPQVQYKNQNNKTQKQLLEELGDIDLKIRQLSVSLTPQIRNVVISALDNTMLGGGILNRLKGKDQSKVYSINKNKLVSNKDQMLIIEMLSASIPKSSKQSEASALNEALALFSRRKRLLKIISRNIQIKAFYKVWLMLHIPATIALLAALIVHILVVFLYW